MSNLTHYIPDLFPNFFDDLKAPSYIIKPLHGKGLEKSFKVDVKETDDSIIINAQIPGVKKEDIAISVDGGVITIKAEIKQFDHHENEKLIQSECYFGVVSRSFQLPVNYDKEKTNASYENGVLKLVLPKLLKNKSHEIKVS